MAISDETIQEFRDVVKEEYGAEMTWKESTEIVHGLTGFFDVLYQIDRRENPEKYKKRLNK